MIYLILSVISSSMIFVVFKNIDRQGIGLFPAILCNYMAAFLLGMILSEGILFSSDLTGCRWMPVAAFTGILFVVGFFLIGLSTKKAGITTTTVASKMSVVVPVSFSIVMYGEAVSWLKITGIGLALAAVVFTVYRKREEGSSGSNFFLPAVLFLFLGTSDSFIKFAQAEFIDDALAPIFSAMVFAFAGISGLIYYLIWGNRILNSEFPRTLLYGSVLGIFNFGSIFFLIKTLNSGVLASSIVFSVNNAGIVGLSVAVAVVFFGERLGNINKIGIALAMLSIVLLFNVN